MLYETIKHLYPDAVNGVDYKLRDDADGKGPYIHEWNLNVPKPTAAQLKSAEGEVWSKVLCANIDHAADQCRAKIVQDPVRTEEYKLAAEEAKAFKAAGYPENNVPRTVAAWVTASRTARQAADSILQESQNYYNALYTLREARLQAKEEIRALCVAGDTETATELADQTIEAIQQAGSGVGNNG